LKISPGRPHPLGATWDGRGVNFALFSENVTTVELCLVDEAAPHTDIARIAVDTLLMLLNANQEPADFSLPNVRECTDLRELLDDTAKPDVKGKVVACAKGDAYQLEGRSLALLRYRAGEDT
jgi:pullulanase/glycogen debranching enzyme